MYKWGKFYLSTYFWKSLYIISWKAITWNSSCTDVLTYYECKYTSSVVKSILNKLKFILPTVALLKPTPFGYSNTLTLQGKADALTVFLTNTISLF